MSLARTHSHSLRGTLWATWKLCGFSSSSKRVQMRSRTDITMQAASKGPHIPAGKRPRVCFRGCRSRGRARPGGRIIPFIPKKAAQRMMSWGSRTFWMPDSTLVNTGDPHGGTPLPRPCAIGTAGLLRLLLVGRRRWSTPFHASHGCRSRAVDFQGPSPIAIWGTNSYAPARNAIPPDSRGELLRLQQWRRQRSTIAAASG